MRTDPAVDDLSTVDELTVHPAEFGKLAARHNLVEIAEQFVHRLHVMGVPRLLDAHHGLSDSLLVFLGERALRLRVGCRMSNRRKCKS